MKETIEVVKAALNESERAQSAAMDAIQQAQNNTKNTLDLLMSVSLESISNQNDAYFMYKITLHCPTLPPMVSHDIATCCCTFCSECFHLL